MDILVLGGGDIGYHIALAVSREHREVVMVEADRERVERLDEYENDIQIVHGSAADPEVLVKAGLRHAKLVVAVTNCDEVNIAACYLASRLAPDSQRVARIRQFNTRSHGHLLTDPPPLVHSIINPEELCARKIADLARYPGTVDVNWFFNHRVVLVGVPVGAESPMAGKSLLEVGRGRGVSTPPFLVAMVVRGGEASVPGAAEKLVVGDLLYLVSLADRLDDTLDLFLEKARRAPLGRVAVFGGSNIGMFLAELLEKKCPDVRLVEADEERSSFLADRLDKTMVLCGDPFEKNVFADEEFADIDAFVAATVDQEDNIIAALQAKTRGARMTVAVVHREQMADLACRAGVDAVVAPRQVAIGNILERIRAGDVSAVTVLNQGDMEVVEVSVPAGAKLAGKPLAEVNMPGGALLLAVERGGVVAIPDGGTVLEPGDRVAIISRRRDLRNIEKMLAGKRFWW